MSEFKQYNRSNFAELRAVTQEESERGYAPMRKKGIAISDVDLSNGSPQIGDMIARNPRNHEDQWLVAAIYFNNNFVVNQ